PICVTYPSTTVPLTSESDTARTRPVSHARKLAMYLLRTEVGLSHAEVGRLVGRGSATVITLTCEVAEDVHGAVHSEIDRASTIAPLGRSWQSSDWERSRTTSAGKPRGRAPCHL